jgi:molybdopterin-containing oxidoreductase family iron-sulfur binding subunit
MKRRRFLKVLTGAAAGAAAATTTGCAPGGSWEKFFQSHYKEMSDEEKRSVFARIEREQKERYGATVEVRDPKPIPGVRFAFAISLSRCNGNRQCVAACVKENNQSRGDRGAPPIEYIKVIELDQGTFDLEKGSQYYDHEEVPKPGKVYLPIQCNQCDNPPCTRACPVQATWKEEDGIVVIDADWCIGCRYCMAACPYEARHFNFIEPALSPQELNPNQGYLSNRPRSKGVVEKCHFCLHRTREGHFPACHEACPTGARKFGNLLDPNSEVATVLREKRVFVLKEELNTIPHVFYFFD